MAPDCEQTKSFNQPCIGNCRINFKGTGKGYDSLIELTKFGEGEAFMVNSIRITGIDLKCMGKCIYCFVMQPDAAKDNPL